MLGLSLGLTRPAPQAVPSAPHPETVALLARMDVQPDAARTVLIDWLMRRARGAGVLQKLDAFYILAAHDAQAARLNWAGPAYDCTIVNAPIFTADRGYVGATGSLLSTGFNPTSAPAPKYALNDASLHAWVITEEATPLRHVLSAVSSDRRAYLNPRQTGDTFIYAINTNADRSRGNWDSRGMFSGCRASAGSTESYINGISRSSQGNAPNGLPDAPFGICGRDSGFTDTRQVAFAAIGANLTATEVLALHDAVRAYLVAVGAVS